MDRETLNLSAARAIAKTTDLFFVNRKVIHAHPRIAPFPINDERVDRNPPPLLWPTAEGEGVRVADWSIRARLEADQNPALEIRHQTKHIALAADMPWIAVGEKRHSTPNATLLVEPFSIYMSKDTLPRAAP